MEQPQSASAFRVLLVIEAVYVFEVPVEREEELYETQLVSFCAWHIARNGALRL
jgi:hypothetical protein